MGRRQDPHRLHVLPEQGGLAHPEHHPVLAGAVRPLATVTPAVTASNKIYDGNTTATLSSCTVTGAVGGDVVACAGTATFAS